MLDGRDLRAAAYQVRSELTGAGVLDRYLADPEVTDVLVNAPDSVWIERAGTLSRADVRFPDEAAVRRLAQRLAAHAGRRLDDAAPCVDGVLPDGARLHAVLPPVAVRGTLISLRVPPRRAFTMDRLTAGGMTTEHGARLLQSHRRRAAVVSGHRRDRQRQDDAARRAARPGAGRRADRGDRGMRRGGRRPSARGAAAVPDRQPGEPRRGEPADAGPAGTADAAGPGRGRRGARTRGAGAAGRHEHRARRMRGDAARQRRRGRRGPRRGPRRPGRAGARRAARPAGLGGAGGRASGAGEGKAAAGLDRRHRPRVRRDRGAARRGLRRRGHGDVRSRRGPSQSLAGLGYPRGRPTDPPGAAAARTPTPTIWSSSTAGRKRWPSPIVCCRRLRSAPSGGDGRPDEPFVADYGPSPTRRGGHR